MRPLRKLMLNFRMLLQLNFQKFLLLLHLFILINELLDMLRLVFQLGRQLNVLLNSKLSGSFQLVLVHREHIALHILNIHKHLLSKLVNRLSAVPFDRRCLAFMLFIHLLQLRVQRLFVKPLLVLVLLPILNIINHFLLHSDRVEYILLLHGHLSPDIFDSVLMSLVHSQDNLSLVLLFLVQLFDLVLNPLAITHVDVYFLQISLPSVLPLVNSYFAPFVQVFVVFHPMLIEYKCQSYCSYGCLIKQN